ncbi:hypothetical protein, partial [Aeromonas caviae]|uniref:hypothetical protein n=1 Tax=Aeromonas caviae TaxID=648 RepID=UPI001CC5E389
PVLQPEASSPGAKDENTGAGLCRSRLVVQERLGHYNRLQLHESLFDGWFAAHMIMKYVSLVQSLLMQRGAAYGLSSS